MILTVTLNPLLEHRLTYRKINIGRENRFAKEDFKAGGKGINVSRQLNLLLLDNIAFTFLGGHSGKKLKTLLSEEKINFTSISTQAETRSSAIIIDESDNSITSYFGNDPRISSREADEFKSKLEKMIQNCEIVVFSGSSPCGETNSIFSFGIETANRYDKISICDTYGEHLKSCINASPTIIHNNVDEIERSLGIPLRSEAEAVNFMKFLHSKNIKQAFITDGANPAYAANLDFLYKINNPTVSAIDSTGSGDAFVAGVAYGWHNNLPFEKILRIASSLGVLNSTKFDVCNIMLEEIEKVKEKIEIIPIGKKMRMVDVSSS